MEAALAAMEKTVRALGSVPDDWKPAVGAVGGPLLEEGSAVQVREKYRGLYEFLPATTKPLKDRADQPAPESCARLWRGTAR